MYSSVKFPVLVSFLSISSFLKMNYVIDLKLNLERTWEKPEQLIGKHMNAWENEGFYITDWHCLTSYHLELSEEMSIKPFNENECINGKHECIITRWNVFDWILM